MCAASHQRQQVEEQPGVLADEVVGLTTQVHKELETTGGPLASVDDVRHVRGQDEWSAVPEDRTGRGQGSRSWKHLELLHHNTLCSGLKTSCVASSGAW